MRCCTQVFSWFQHYISLLCSVANSPRKLSWGNLTRNRSIYLIVGRSKYDRPAPIDLKEPGVRQRSGGGTL
ncbi:hypothetical protein LSAT2_027235 [Lamellibrachia satsuma]|nr:hypothetical protein LSAT2_027235 [Lamellibrachia satsuma]